MRPLHQRPHLPSSGSNAATAFQEGRESIRIPILREIEDKDDPKGEAAGPQDRLLFALPQVELKCESIEENDNIVSMAKTLSALFDSDDD